MRLNKCLRFFAVILSLSICLSAMNVAANVNKSPGLQELKLNNTMVSGEQNAFISGKEITINANGIIQFEFLLPFESDILVVNYNKLNANTVLTIETDEGNVYTQELNVNDTSCKIPIKEFYGSKVINFSADKNVTLISVVFEKINELFSKHGLIDVDYTDYQYELLNAIVIKDNATAIISRGATLFYDNDDRSIVPLNIEGSMYVPVKILAAELSLYCEDYPDKNYILLRGEKYDMVLNGGKGYIESDESGRKDVELNVVYKNGKTWVPVRKLAEYFGYYVGHDLATKQQIIINNS